MRWALAGTFVAMGAVNYLCRALFTVLVPRHGVGPFWERFLSAIPLSILTALAAPEAFGGGPGPARLVAALCTVLIARLSGNLLVSVGSGTLIFALLSR